jgi:hypothetical protein
MAWPLKPHTLPARCHNAITEPQAHRGAHLAHILDLLRRIVGASLTTSAMSRHTFSVQAAGAGSHKQRAGGGGRGHDRRVPSVSTLSAQSVSPHHDGVLHQTSLRSRWTMMTRANSLHVREAGRPINVSVTRARGPAPTRASPHRHRSYNCRARPRRQNSA